MASLPSITPIDLSSSSRLESEHVSSVYQSIAPHFSHTRYKPWPRVESFILSLPSHSLIADVGCGNGKYLSVNTTGITLGCDTCYNLLTLAKSHTSHLFLADATSIHMRDNTCDAVISIAVIHHLSNEERRIEALREMARVLVPGGRMLVYVWAMEQEKRIFTAQDVLVPWHMQKAFSVDGKGDGKRKKKRREKKTKIAKSVKSGGIVQEVELCDLFGDAYNSDQNSENDVTAKANHNQDPIPLTADKSDVEHTPSENVPKEKSDIDKGRVRQEFETYMRYYHVFRENELRELVEKHVSSVRVIESYYDHENWCVTAVKMTDKVE